MADVRCARRPGFTMVELMVAAAMAFVIVGTGAQLASTMVRATRKYEEQAELGARSATAAAVVKSLLTSAAYNWSANGILSATTSTGSFGVGHCSLSTNICPASKTMLPLETCSSPTVTDTTCPATTTTTADAVKTLLPRDGTIEAVIVADRTPVALPTTCPASTATLTLNVKGTTQATWAVNDLVLVANGQHVNVGRVATAFAPGADPTVTRVLELDLGDTADFALDDGGSGTACSLAASLKRATVMRVKQVIIKHDNALKELVFAEKATSAAALVFRTLVPDVEDFGVRFDVARLPGGATPSGVARICTADTSGIFAGGTTLTGACAGERLNGDIAAAALNRVIGMNLGVVVRSRVATQTVNENVLGLFDRTGSVANDQRLHRRNFFYVGLPNANAF